ncbi:MAG: hypothetical protein SGPRY_002519 [Prymnesium sp.]
MRCFRFFDSEVDYAPTDLNAILRALQQNDMKKREEWFTAVRRCRRRSRRDWSAAPVAKLFKIRDEYQLLRQQATRNKIASALSQANMHPSEFFNSCDKDQKGVLTASALHAGLKELRVEVEQQEVVDFVLLFDSDNDKCVSFAEWCAMYNINADEHRVHTLLSYKDLEPSSADDDARLLDEFSPSRKGPPHDDPTASPSPHPPFAAGDSLTRPNDGRGEVELLSMAGASLLVCLSDAGKLNEVWTSIHTYSEKKSSLWAPSVADDSFLGGQSKQRICVGHYGSAEYRRPRERALLPLLEDKSVWNPFARSRWLPEALEMYAPHPDNFRQVWRKVAENKAKGASDLSKPLYAWEPLARSNAFVALGMVFTTSPDPPERTSVRVIHHSWTRVVKEPPKFLWDNRHIGGGGKSYWIVNHHNLVWATIGWEAPKGPFYEMREVPFSLEEIQIRPGLATTNSDSREQGSECEEARERPLDDPSSPSAEGSAGRLPTCMTNEP